MSRSIPFHYRKLLSLPLSTLLVFTLFSTASAKKDHHGNPHSSHGAVIKVPGSEVPIPGVTVLKDKPFPKDHIASRPPQKKKYSTHPKRPHNNRKYYKEKHWRHWDKEYGHSPWDYRHRPRHGSFHRDLPRNSFRFFIGGVPFFYAAGVYFQAGPQGYVVVRPPIGSRIRVLPEGCSFFMYGGRHCYSCDDVFYEEMGSEYVVINRPPSYRIIAVAGDEVEINANSLNVRSGPGLRYEAVDRLHRGDIAEVIAVDGDWYCVNLGYDNFGWIKSQYTRIISLKEDPKG